MNDALFVACAFGAITIAYFPVKWLLVRLSEWASGLNDPEKRKARWLADRKYRYANLRQRQLEAWARDHEVK